MSKTKLKSGRKNIAGINIARIRKEQGLSVDDLSKTLRDYGIELSPKDIERIEDGRRAIYDTEVVNLTRALGCSLEEIMKHEPVEMMNGEFL